jgi:hypothetical protein
MKETFLGLKNGVFLHYVVQTDYQVEHVYLYLSITNINFM